VLPQLRRTLTAARPIVGEVAPRACAISDAMTGWSEYMKFGTAYDNFIRFTPTLTQTLLTGLNQASLPSTPYPGPCVGNVGEAGGNKQTPDEQVAAR
jgi:hypothetical protein